jgi:putative membrane protein
VAVLSLTCVVLAGFLYWQGTRRPSGSRARRERPWRGQAFYAGLAALALAIAPPLDEAADRLFWAHMVQHALLQMVAPPLIVLGAPWLAMSKVISPGERRRAGRWVLWSPRAEPLRGVARVLAAPAIAWLLFVGVIWLSHLPAIFDFAAHEPAFHEFEHVLFLLLGLIFWSRVLDSPPFRARVTQFRRFGYFLSAGLAEAVLAVVILAAHSPLYNTYRAISPRPEHLTALQDQQLGGAMMLEPASISLLLAAIWSLGVALGPRIRRSRESSA